MRSDGTPLRFENNRTLFCNGRVTFFPGGRTVEASAGSTLLDAALDHGVDLPHECGGNCACTTCHVLVRKGGERLSPPEETESDRLATAEGRTPMSRLACQTLFYGGDVTVEIVGAPEASALRLGDRE